MDVVVQDIENIKENVSGDIWQRDMEEFCDGSNGSNNGSATDRQPEGEEDALWISFWMTKHIEYDGYNYCLHRRLL